MKRILKIELEFKDLKLHARPDAISHVVSLIEQAFMNEPLEIQDAWVSWVEVVEEPLKL